MWVAQSQGVKLVQGLRGKCLGSTLGKGKKLLEKQSCFERKWLNVLEVSGAGPQASRHLFPGTKTWDIWKAGTTRAQGSGSDPRVLQPVLTFPHALTLQGRGGFLHPTDGTRQMGPKSPLCHLLAV